MFKETVLNVDKARMIDEIVDKGLLEPQPSASFFTGETNHDSNADDGNFVSPPDPFNEAFVTYHWPDRTEKNISELTLPTVQHKGAELGEIQGLDKALQLTQDFLASVRGLWDVVQASNLQLSQNDRDEINRIFSTLIHRQEQKTGETIPQAISESDQISRKGNRSRVEHRLNHIDACRNKLRAVVLHLSDGKVPEKNVMQFNDSNIATLKAPAHTQGVLLIFSKMQSSYQYTGTGTNWGEALTGSVMTAGDRPWFAKVSIPAAQIIDQTGNPFESFPEHIAQLGVAGDMVQVHQYTLRIPASGELHFPFQVNGSFGQARFLFLPEDNHIQPIDQYFYAEGVSSNDYVQTEKSRYREVVRKRRLIESHITLGEQMMIAIASAVANMPELGTLFNTAIRTLQLLIHQANEGLMDHIEIKNHAQQEINLHIARHFPKVSTTDLPKDRYSPH